MNFLIHVNHIFPYALSPLTTLLVCLLLASLTIRADKNNRANRLFAILCLLECLYYFEELCRTLLVSKTFAIYISRLDHLAFVFVTPVGIQLAHQLVKVNNRKWLERGLYAFSFILLPFTQTTWYIADAYEYFFGFFVKAGYALQAFALVSLFSAIYTMALFIQAIRKSKNSDEKRKFLFMLWGISIGWLLNALNILPASGINIYPPGNFSFIPLSLVAYGLLQHELLDTSNAFLKKGYIGQALSYLAFLPLIISIIFLFLFYEVNFNNFSSFFDRLLPYGIAPIISSIICSTLSFFCFRLKNRQLKTILFGLICLFWGCLQLNLILSLLVKSASVAIKISQVVYLFTVNSLGVEALFVYLIVRRKNRFFVYLSLLIGFLLIFISQGNHFFSKDVYSYEFGLYPKPNFIYHLFSLFGLISSFWFLYLLFRRYLNETEKNHRKKVFYVLTGMILILAFKAGEIPSSFGYGIYPASVFAFIPALLIAYGLFHQDLLKSTAYTKKLFFKTTVRFILVFATSVLLLVACFSLKPYDLNHIINKIVPYGIPPLISFLCCIVLSFLVQKFGFGQHQMESFLFSIICFLYGALNLDILLNGIVTDASIALKISRWDHFLIVFELSFNLHLAYVVTRRTSKWWIVYASYILNLIVAPLTQTRFYFTGNYHYYWGYFAKKGIVFDFMTIIWIFFTGYGIKILYDGYKSASSKFHKSRILYMIGGFACAGILTLGNIPALNGIEVYPSGNFTFFAILLLAYGLFKNHIRETLQIFRTFLFWVGTFTILWGITILINAAFSLESHLFNTLLLTFSIILLFGPVKTLWSMLLNLIIRNRADDLKDCFYNLTNTLTQIHNFSELHDRVSSLLFQELLSGRCATLFYFKSDLIEGWEIINPMPYTGFFAHGSDKLSEKNALKISITPKILDMLFSYKTLIMQENIEEYFADKENFLNESHPITKSEVILPIFFQDQFRALILIGNKVDGSDYSRDEIDFFRQLGLVLGPYVSNADLLQNLETQVQERTKQIERQYQIFKFLLETSTTIELTDDLEELFNYTISQINHLFPDLALGLVLNGGRPEIIECAVFFGISKEEEELILKNNTQLIEVDINDLLSKFIKDADSLINWIVLPMLGRELRIIGKLIIKGPKLTKQEVETIILFLNQLAAVAENKLLTQQLEKMANTDALTGTYNRAYFEKELLEISKKSSRYAKSFSVMSIDVNGLKQVNDFYGHQAGDEMIVKVAQLLSSICRQTDIVSRIGGDEFVILCPATTHEQSEILLLRIREKEANSFLICTLPDGEKKSIPIHMSIGLACSDDFSSDHVFKEADKKMYEDKHAYYENRKRYR